MAIIYGNFTDIKGIIQPYPFEFSITARGNGSGLLKIMFNVWVTATYYVTGTAKLYTNEAGTLGECTEKSVTAAPYGSPTTMWLKLTSGTAKLYFKTKAVRELYILDGASAANQPMLGGDFSNMIRLEVLIITSRSNFYSSISKLVNIKTLNGTDRTYNEGEITGTTDNLVNCSNLVLHDYSVLRIPESSMHITGDVANFKHGILCELVDDEHLSLFFTGDFTEVDPKILYGDGWNECFGTIDGWDICYYIETNCPNVTVNTVIGMKALGYFQMPNVIFTQTQINQIAIDLWANVDELKTYVPTADRTYDLSGAIGTPSPSGAGAVAVANLRSWVGPNGQHNNVTTR